MSNAISPTVLVAFWHVYPDRAQEYVLLGMLEGNELLEVCIVPKRTQHITAHRIREQVAKAFTCDAIIKKGTCFVGYAGRAQLLLHVVVAAGGDNHHRSLHAKCQRKRVIGRCITCVQGNHNVT